MNEQIILLVIFIFIIVILSRFVVRMMTINYEKYKIIIFYSRIFLGFLLAMLLYIIYLMLIGEDVIHRIFG